MSTSMSVSLPPIVTPGASAAQASYPAPQARTILATIARKEIVDALRNRLFLLALVMLVALSLVAVGLGATTVHTRLTEYQQSVDLLKSLGKTQIPPMPTLNPLAVSKTFINYLAMLGALMGMILGFTTIHKERQAGSLPLILSRPVYRDQLLTGKVLGNAGLMLSLTLAVGAVTIVALAVIGGVGLGGDEVMKVALTMGMSWLYMLTFFLLAMFFSLWMPNSNQALLLTVIVWLVFAFIFPQIGDTMDLDNQLPGGFFASMGMNKAQATTALQKFHLYEVIRDGVEELSPTKHYERISFALLGVKTEFANNTWLEVLQLKIVNLIGLLVPIVLLLSASYIVYLRKET
jgi:ABC-2 type transport system permease protein